MWRQLTRTDDTVMALVLRLALGVVMFPHGAQKLLGWFGGLGVFGTIELFHQLGFSTLVAVLVTIGEFLGGLGLLLGFLSRVAAAGIGIIMVGAVLTVNWRNGFFMNWAGKPVREGFEFHILAIGLVVAIMILGGGKWSVDRALTERNPSP
jgi:putative oxidoreductase